MGLETLALASLATTAATTVVQAVQARKASKAQEEANSISIAGQEVQDRVARRRAIRESRIRQAMIENSAVSSGATGSSGESGAIAALGSNTGAAVANQQSQSLTAAGVTRQNQRAASAESRFQQIGAFGAAVNQGISLWDQATKQP